MNNDKQNSPDLDDMLAAQPQQRAQFFDLLVNQYEQIWILCDDLAFIWIL